MNEKSIILKSIKKRMKKIINKKDKKEEDFITLKNLKAIEILVNCF